MTAVLLRSMRREIRTFDCQVLVPLMPPSAAGGFTPSWLYAVHVRQMTYFHTKNLPESQGVAMRRDQSCLKRKHSSADGFALPESLSAAFFGEMLSFKMVRCRGTLQDLNNVLGSLYLVMVFLGIINATSVQPVAHMERSVSPQIPICRPGRPPTLPC